jgi:hypothetical protein
VRGNWSASDGEYEQVLSLLPGGHGIIVVTNIATQTCNYITFDFTLDADSIYVSDDNLGNAHYTLSANGATLTINPGADQTVFTRVQAPADTTGCTWGMDMADYDPDVAYDATGNDGTADLVLPNYAVHLTVQDEGGAPVPGAAVSLFQGQSTALVWIQQAGYYPLFRVLDLGGQSSYTFTLTMVGAGGYFQILSADPDHIGDLFSDHAVTPHCYQGTLADILSAGMTTFDGYLAIRVIGEAAALGGGGVVNLGLFTAGINEAIFQELMFGATSIMAGDVVQFCLYSINVGGTDYYLPYVQISDVIDQVDDYAYKFIVTWGENPADLDSHLFTPEIGGSTHHVFYANTGSATSPPYAWLDVDDVTSWGPEAITIEQLFPGTYTFAVYEYSGAGTLSTSQAHVDVFHGRTLVGGYDVPAVQDGDNWWWTVGTVNGATGAFTLVNTLTPDPPPGAPRLARENLPLK